MAKDLKYMATWTDLKYMATWTDPLLSNFVNFLCTDAVERPKRSTQPSARSIYESQNKIMCLVPMEPVY
jgi:hypothetical protein